MSLAVAAILAEQNESKRCLIWDVNTDAPMSRTSRVALLLVVMRVCAIDEWL